jgi:hypothetical protein
MEILWLTAPDRGLKQLAHYPRQDPADYLSHARFLFWGQLDCVNDSVSGSHLGLQPKLEVSFLLPDPASTRTGISRGEIQLTCPPPFSFRGQLVRVSDSGNGGHLVGYSRFPKTQPGPTQLIKSCVPIFLFQDQLEGDWKNNLHAGFVSLLRMTL